MTRHQFGTAHRDPSVAHFSWGTYNLRPDPQPMVDRQRALTEAGDAMAALLDLRPDDELAQRLVATWRKVCGATDVYGWPTDPDEYAERFLALTARMGLDQ